MMPSPTPADIQRHDFAFKLDLFEEDRDPAAARRRPIMQVDHHKISVLERSEPDARSSARPAITGKTSAAVAGLHRQPAARGWLTERTSYNYPARSAGH